MSLIQRVAPIEGTDRQPLRQLPDGWGPGYGTLSREPDQQSLLTGGRPLRRPISYDALPAISKEEPETANSRQYAFTVSTTRRVAQVIATVIFCWLASGIVFGFAALKPVLISEGVYRDKCTQSELEDDVRLCKGQDLRLNFFFAIASTTSNVSALIVGAMLDRRGPRACAIMGSFFLALGSLLMALAFHYKRDHGLVWANMFLALGGTFVFLPAFSIANAFPKAAGSIIAAVTSAFDASAAVFLIYRLLYERSKGKFTPDLFFAYYLIVPVLLVITNMTLMLRDGYMTVPQLEAKTVKHENPMLDVHDSDDELSDSEVRKLRARRRERRESKLAQIEDLLGDSEERVAREEERHESSGVWGALHGQPAYIQMRSPWFILICAMTVLQMLRMNFFIATIRRQYEFMLGSEEAARKINSFFDVALPVGGLAATPFIGMLLDGVSTGNVLAVLVTLTTLVGVLGSIPSMVAGYGNVVLFVLLRPLYYSAMSDYATKVFGFATFGQIYGTIIFLSGVINLMQPFLDEAISETGNPILVNAVLAALGFVVGTALVIFVKIQGKRVQNEFRKDADTLSRIESIAESEFEG
ncbi:MFS general substrate transporter [Piedraia hortae CBS 480.64]|uniref:MFS general substrate transporter n=1 Tax=Piedraia hortae CBS 480.64 TaxID=1314780 RepID=A0A6A7BY66_9PEZI|nr:MFS general substrate transporter [Piedraia hortae CBS 480.64]